ncbi:MAG: hypothetical protein ACOYT4_00135 [Nanoarchaeota archaeon]
MTAIPYSNMSKFKIYSKDVPQGEDFNGTLKEAKVEAEKIKRQHKGDYKTWIGRDGLRVVLLSGPSCVGKGPLVASIDKFFPNISYSTVPVIKAKESRPKGPRPEELDLWDNPNYFRSANEIKNLSKDPLRYLVGECRGLPNAIDLDRILGAKHNLVLVEVYHTVGSQINSLKNILPGADKLNVFVSPVSQKEITAWKLQNVGLDQKIKKIMLNKLNARSKYQGANPEDPSVIKDNLKRAEDAYHELQSAHKYTHVLVNPYGEGHPHWNRTPNGEFTKKPQGGALKIVKSFADILKKGKSKYVEHWDSDTI